MAMTGEKKKIRDEMHQKQCISKEKYLAFGGLFCMLDDDVCVVLCFFFYFSLHKNFAIKLCTSIQNGTKHKEM